MKTYKPTTKSRRQMTNINYRDFLTKTKPTKSLTYGFRRSVGRNSAGRITMRHKGAGHKRLYRDVDFLYDKKDIPAKITTIEYDPNRSAFIGLAVYKDGEKRYIVIPKAVKTGMTFLVSEKAELSVGNRLPLKNIPVGTFVYNIEIKPRGGAKIPAERPILAPPRGFISILYTNVPTGIFFNGKRLPALSSAFSETIKLSPAFTPFGITTYFFSPSL